MAISTSPTAQNTLENEPNVVPMIDILLVLLIIFMLIIPLSRKAIDLQLPDPNPDQSTAPPPSQIVMEVLPGGRFLVNKEPIPKADLGRRLKAIYEPRPDKVIFIKGDESIKYADVIEAMDIARGSGAVVLGLTPRDTKK